MRGVDELERGVGELLVGCFHALAGQGPSVFNFAVGIGVNNPPRSEALAKFRVLGIKIGFGFFFSIQVIQIAKKLVKAMIAGQKLILVAQMVLAKLAGGITVWLE